MSEPMQVNKKTADRLKENLIALVKDWDATSLVPKDQKDKCREIGVALNELGGMDMMREGYYAAKNSNRCAMSISAYWDGVGQWKW